MHVLGSPWLTLQLGSSYLYKDLEPYSVLSVGLTEWPAPRHSCKAVALQQPVDQLTADLGSGEDNKELSSCNVGERKSLH